jgi:polyribonucleotide nucleotidyltransferase
LSYDQQNFSDVISIIGASAALSISGIPFLHPVCGARVAYIQGHFVLNPTSDQMVSSCLDLVVAGTRDGVLMVESEADSLSEAVMLDAIKFGHESFKPVLDAIESLREKAGKPLWWVPQEKPEYPAIKDFVVKNAEQWLREDFKIKEKLRRHEAVAASKQRAIELFAAGSGSETKGAGIAGASNVAGESHSGGASSAALTQTPATSANKNLVAKAFDELEYELLRSDVLQHGRRVDGRKVDEIRPICCEVGVLPRVHGSAIFTRGETQVLVVTTLGSADDGQVIDCLAGEYKEHFMLHYNFPPYSVGEIGRLSSPGRREIGHGRLAWRAIHPLIPQGRSFPYTIRVVAEVTESNGSSSMATVCGASLALMDAGVPVKNHVSGIAMGLIKEGDEFVVLSDIQGDEDHLGDMDFKVAGTTNGITSLQMDIKITSITFEIMKKALDQALVGRQHIAGIMQDALKQARVNPNVSAPQIMTMEIAKERIRDLIGPGGKVIKEICEKTGAKIDVSDNGSVSIFAKNQQALQDASAMICEAVGDPEIGQVYTGKVVKLMDFGAFVNFFGRRDGFLHVSEVSNERVENIEDVLNIGDEVRVLLIDIDDRTKRCKLSMKALSGKKPRNDGNGGRGGGNGRDGGERGGRDGGERGGRDGGGERGGRPPRR